MADDNANIWPAPDARHDVTCTCEHGLRAASGILWQGLGLLAGGHAKDLGADYFSPARQMIAEYLKRTGRPDEAMQVAAIGCNEPPPPTGFGALTAAQRDHLRDVLGS
jgi:hypothetical protein